MSLSVTPLSSSFVSFQQSITRLWLDIAKLVHLNVGGKVFQKRYMALLFNKYAQGLHCLNFAYSGTFWGTFLSWITVHRRHVPAPHLYSLTTMKYLKLGNKKKYTRKKKKDIEKIINTIQSYQFIKKLSTPTRYRFINSIKQNRMIDNRIY